MIYDHFDYRDINRGFKRKVNRAKNKGETEIVLDLNFALNVAAALDGLVFYWKNTKPEEETK